MIEVRYAGVVVGRSAIIRELDTRGLFLGITEPMPVGTTVSLRIGDRAGAEEVPGKVEVVSESQELARAGMRVRFLDPAAAVLFGTPSEAGPEPEPIAFPTAITAIDTVDESAAPDAAASAAPSGHRRIVVDASTEKPPEPAPNPTSADDLELSGPSGSGNGNGNGNGMEGGRIAAPDPSAFGGGGGGSGGKKGRRNRRR